MKKSVYRVVMYHLMVIIAILSLLMLCAEKGDCTWAAFVAVKVGASVALAASAWFIVKHLPEEYKNDKI